MRVFDPHIHMTSRTTDDYRAMYDSRRPRSRRTLLLARPAPDLARLLPRLLRLAPRLGTLPRRPVRHRPPLRPRPQPQGGQRPPLHPVLDDLPRYLAKDGVVAVGEIGYDSLTPAEDTALAAQLQLAADHGLPALVHTPHRDKLTGLRRTIDVVRESPLAPDRVLLDHLNETTVKEAADSGAWLGFSVYPDTKMDVDRMVAILRNHGTTRVLVNSAADWGRSDPLKTRAVGDAMLATGFTDDDVDQVLWRNPVAFYGLSGRLRLDLPSPQDLHEGNSLLRGGE